MAKRFVSKLVERVIRAAEAMHRQKVITFESQFNNPKQLTDAGGKCSCCGAGPRVTDEHDWWLVFKAGLCNSDGMFYAMLCDGPSGEGCLSVIRAENTRRKPTFRDDVADIISMMNGDDVDGMQADFEDADFMGMLDRAE